jgi:hypothetical protein
MFLLLLISAVFRIKGELLLTWQIVTLIINGYFPFLTMYNVFMSPTYAHLDACHRQPQGEYY